MTKVKVDSKEVKKMREERKMATQAKIDENRKESYVTPELTKQPNLKEITQTSTYIISRPTDNLP